MNKKRILWITNLPSPYRVDFFNELGKQIDLTVLFERKSSSERDKSWEDYNFISFKPVFINGFKVGVDKTFSFKIISYLKKNEFDKIIISSYSSPSEIFAAFYLCYCCSNDYLFRSRNSTCYCNRRVLLSGFYYATDCCGNF